MARRRKLEAPSQADLQAMQAEFRGETSRAKGPAAPIAQVAQDTASQVVIDPDARAIALKNEQDANTLRAAEDDGRLIIRIPLDQIEPLAIARDRMVLDAEELQELKLSISANGLRLPIEVFATKDDARPFGLLSGYRRLKAFKDLQDLTKADKFATIPAIIREPQTLGGPFAAMIEENEIRASLSQFERGRIAVIATQQEVFETIEAAVNALFPMASKAKRSKIRSFARIFEELGDMLEFADKLTEKDGLQIANALRQDQGKAFRNALAQRTATTPAEEIATLRAALAQMEPDLDAATRGGRPRKDSLSLAEMHSLSSGFNISHGPSANGYRFDVAGRRMSPEIAEELIRVMSRVLDDSL